MNMRRRIWSIVLALTCTAVLGCQSVPVQFETPRTPIAKISGGRPVEAEACGFQLLLLIPIEVNNRAWRAWERLQQTTSGSTLTDVTLTERWFYGLVGTGYCTKMSATAY